MAKTTRKGGSGNTAAICYRLAQPVAEELGLFLWDVRFVKEGTDWFLRIAIDKDEGVSIDDCVAMSRRMSDLLDEVDPIPQSYCLEVMSPGIERELTRPEHFAAYEGWPVAVRLFRPLDGVREFAGLLTGYADHTITIEEEDGTVRSFDKKDVSLVHAIDEDDFLPDELEDDAEND